MTDDVMVPDLLELTPQEMEEGYLELRRISYHQLAEHARLQGLLTLLVRPITAEELAARAGFRFEHWEVLHRFLAALVKAGAVQHRPDGRFQAVDGALVEPEPQRELIARSLGPDRVDHFLERDLHDGILTYIRQPGDGRSEFDQDVPAWSDTFNRPCYRYSRLRAARWVADSGERFLDLGCGTGEGTHELVGMGGRGTIAVGVDLSFPQLAHAARSDAQGPSPWWINADLDADLPFANQQFDAVVAVGVVHFLHSVEHFFAEAARVLRPDGRLCVAHAYVHRGSPDQEFVDLMMAGGNPRGIARRVGELCASAASHGFSLKPSMFYIGCFVSMEFERIPLAGNRSRKRTAEAR